MRKSPGRRPKPSFASSGHASPATTRMTPTAINSRDMPPLYRRVIPRRVSADGSAVASSAVLAALARGQGHAPHQRRKADVGGIDKVWVDLGQGSLWQGRGPRLRAVRANEQCGEDDHHKHHRDRRDERGVIPGRGEVHSNYDSSSVTSARVYTAAAGTGVENSRAQAPTRRLPLRAARSRHYAREAFRPGPAPGR